MTEFGASSGSRERGQEVVPALSGFDPARMPYQPFALEAGQLWRSEGCAMFNEREADSQGDPTRELWRFCGEDDYEDGFGWLEVSLHELVQTEQSGVLAVYYRQWFAPDGQPAWGNRAKRVIGAAGSLKALIRRRKMKLAAIAQPQPHNEGRPGQ